mmetsp:Transcript_53549/g.141164  ORF Transcript_53549/g.141164 Transcript_53549/m.141164 type:complete len:303 (+) Transcript_53549:64-972(+)
MALFLTLLLHEQQGCHPDDAAHEDAERAGEQPHPPHRGQLLLARRELRSWQPQLLREGLHGVADGDAEDVGEGVRQGRAGERRELHVPPDQVVDHVPAKDHDAVVQGPEHHERNGGVEAEQEVLAPRRGLRPSQGAALREPDQVPLYLRHADLAILVGVKLLEDRLEVLVEGSGQRRDRDRPDVVAGQTAKKHVELVVLQLLTDALDDDVLLAARREAGHELPRRGVLLHGPEAPLLEVGPLQDAVHFTRERGDPLGARRRGARPAGGPRRGALLQDASPARTAQRREHLRPRGKTLEPRWP